MLYLRYLKKMGFSSQEISYLQENCISKKYKRGDILANEDTSGQMYYIFSGLVKIEILEASGNNFFRFMTAKHFFPLARGCRRKDLGSNFYYFTALTNVELLLITRQDQAALEKIHQNWDRVLLEDSFAQLSLNDGFSLAISQKRAPDRAVMVLYFLAFNFCENRHNGFIYFPPEITRKVLAEMANTSLVTIGKVLADLQEKGIVKTRRSFIMVTAKHTHPFD